jgi:hypothetical protein
MLIFLEAVLKVSGDLIKDSSKSPSIGGFRGPA